MPGLDSIGVQLPIVARTAIQLHLDAGKPGTPTLAASLPCMPVFVTLRKPGGELRGCVGTLRPVEQDVVRETARSAVMAATRDPRFEPVTRAALAELRIEVSLILPEQAVVAENELDPARYGVIVRDSQGRRGLLLPGIAGIADAHTQVTLARRKAGIPPRALITLARFEVRKYSD